MSDTQFSSVQDFQLTVENLARWTELSLAQSNRVDDGKMKLDRKLGKNVVTVANVIVNKYYNVLGKNRLFWFFYIAQNGVEDYEYNKPNLFTIEYDVKYILISLLRLKRPMLKTAKIKPLYELEQELLSTTESISLKTLVGICVVSNLNVVIVSENGKKWFEICGGEDGANGAQFLIDLTKGIYIGSDILDEIKRIKSQLYKMDSFLDTKLKPISAYKRDELIAICKCFGIDVDDMSNKITKQYLYTQLLPVYS